MEFHILCTLSEKNWLKSSINQRQSVSLKFATVELYVARHSPGGGVVTGDIGKSLGDGVGPGLGNGFRRRCSRCLTVGFVIYGERSAGSDARVDDNFV